MKGNIIYLLALILVGAIACQKKVDIAAEEKVDIAAEEEAIKTALQKEMDAFTDLDYEGVAAVWAHEPYVYKSITDGYIVGWDSLSIWFETTIRELQEKVNEDPENYAIWKGSASNFDIHLNGNVAFVIYDEDWKLTWEGKEYSGVARSVKYFEKKEGEWKLVAIFPQVAEDAEE